MFDQLKLKKKREINNVKPSSIIVLQKKRTIAGNQAGIILFKIRKQFEKSQVRFPNLPGEWKYELELLKKMEDENLENCNSYIIFHQNVLNPQTK